MKNEKPFVVTKSGTISQYVGLKNCTLCGHNFQPEEKFNVIEEAGPFDNDWFGVCKRCTAEPVYSRFLSSNCEVRT